MRLVLFLLLAPTFVSVIAGGVTGGNRVAEGVAVGLMVPVTLVVALLAAPVKQKPRKADPAKIARMEVDLQTGPAWEEEQRWQSEAPTEPDITDTPEALHALETGCTTMLVPRSADHCPRPEGCVISHPCRKCGAPAGQVCVGEDDLMEMTF